MGTGKMERTVRRIAIGAVMLALFVGAITDASTAARRRHIVRTVDVGLVSGYADTLDSPDGFVDLEGAVHHAYTEANGKLLVRFTAESFCGGEVRSYCAVRVMVDGQEADPIEADGTHFDATDAGGIQSRAIDRSVTKLTKGWHRVSVQWATVGGPNTEFYIGAWHLTVESLRVIV